MIKTNDAEMFTRSGRRERSGPLMKGSCVGGIGEL
jgi:hypothetical protein